jgi:hypothetical protein
MALLNTHATVKKFMHVGFEEAKAEAIVEAINEQNNELATKKDLELLQVKLESGIKDIEARLDTKIDSLGDKLNSKIDNLENKLESSLKDCKLDILQWMIPMFLTVIGLILGMYFK